MTDCPSCGNPAFAPHTVDCPHYTPNVHEVSDKACMFCGNYDPDEESCLTCHRAKRREPWWAANPATSTS